MHRVDTSAAAQGLALSADSGRFHGHQRGASGMPGKPRQAVRTEQPPSRRWHTMSCSAAAIRQCVYARERTFRCSALRGEHETALRMAYFRTCRCCRAASHSAACCARAGCRSAQAAWEGLFG